MSVFRTAVALMTAVVLAGASESVFAQGGTTAAPNAPRRRQSACRARRPRRRLSRRSS